MKKLILLQIVLHALFLTYHRVSASGDLIVTGTVGKVAFTASHGNESASKMEILSTICNSYLETYKTENKIPHVILAIQFSDKDSFNFRFQGISGPKYHETYQKEFHDYPGIVIKGEISGNRAEKILKLLDYALSSIKLEQDPPNISAESIAIYDSMLLSIDRKSVFALSSNSVIEELLNKKNDRPQPLKGSLVPYYYSQGNFVFFEGLKEFLILDDVFQLISLGRKGYLIFDSSSSFYFYDQKQKKVSERFMIPHCDNWEYIKLERNIDFRPNLYTFEYLSDGASQRFGFHLKNGLGML